MRPPNLEADTRRELLAELPRLWVWDCLNEWHSRTAFGKLLFPVWLALSALQWMAALWFIAFMLLAMFCLGELDTPSGAGVDILPDTHKDRS